MFNGVKEFFDRIRYWNSVDRIGPDLPTQNWKLYFNRSMMKYCKDKFRVFSDSAEVRPGAYIFSPSNVSLGSRVVIRPEVVLAADDLAQIIIEDDVMLGMGVHVYVNNHKFDDPTVPIIDQGYYSSEQVIIEKGAWVGANSIILPGVTIGENAVVGAGSVVTKNVPARTVVAGVPAKEIRKS